MTSEELDIFIKNVSMLFKLKLTGSDPRTKVWAEKFAKMDYQVSQKMVNLYYERGEIKYHEVRPKHIMELYDEARRLLGYIVDDESCGYCKGVGMINVKRYEIGNGWIDYAYRCMCSKGSKMYKNIVQITKADISDYEQVQVNPARYVDVYMYKGNKKTQELVTKELIDGVRTKVYTKEQIDKFKEKKRRENAARR